MPPSERHDRDASHLRAVRPPTSEGGEAAGAPALAGTRGRIQVLLVVALLLAILGLALESRRAARLTGEVTALSARLAEARSALEAHRQRLADVRGRVADLKGRVETLDQLLQADPRPAPEGRPAP